MKIAVSLTGAPKHRLVDIARRAEALGFDAIFQGEHIVLPMANSHEHPYGKIAIDPQTPFFDPFVELAVVAAVTKKLKVATGVIVAGMRDVFATARSITTLDIVSDGRVEIGMGVGWHPDEFALLGQDFANRGAYTDEFIDVLRKLFREAEPSHRGKHIAFDPVGFEPKPRQNGGVPILVGGDSPPAMRRAAQRGDGWYGHADSPQQARERIETINRLVVAEGRDPGLFHRSVQVWNPPSREVAEAYFAAGADRLVSPLFHVKGGDPIEALEAYAESVGLRERV